MLNDAMLDLAEKPDISEDAMLELVDANPTYASLVLSHDVSERVVRRVMERWPDEEGLIDHARAHWNAPLDIMLTQPLHGAHATLPAFLDKVGATEAERAHLWAAFEGTTEKFVMTGEQSGTVGQAWERLRP